MATLDVMIKKRGAMKAKLTNFNNFLGVLTTSKHLSLLQRIDLEGRLSKFDSLYVEFDALQVEIEVLSDRPDEAYEERAAFEERYHSLSAQARCLLSGTMANDDGSVAGSTKSKAGGLQNFIRLPKIDLPHFDGSYQCWLEYRDTYLSLIHNSQGVDDISKFHYLRASLKASAQAVIKNIDFKGSNYSTAWNLLCERYDNSRLLVNNHLQALFDAEAIISESCSSLRDIVDVINKNIRALKTLNEPTEHWDTLIIYMMSKKLDSKTSRYWEQYRNTLSISPTLPQFCSFISKQADLLETLEDNQHLPKFTDVDSKSSSFIVSANNSDNFHQTTPVNKLKCALCSKEHLLYTCDSFRSLPVETRLLKAKEFKVCLNCLRSGHFTKRCRLSRCKYCKGRHNTLLHVDPSNAVPYQDPMPRSVALPVDTSDGASVTTSTSEDVVLSSDIKPTNQCTSSRILLSTALVRAVSDQGEKFDARVLLDNGSTANFVTQSFCNKLGLPRRNTGSKVTGINNQTTISTQSCSLVIESYNGSYKEHINCIILPEVTKLMPSSLIDISNISLPSNLKLADPSFAIPSAVDILVGAEVFWNVVGSSIINLGKNQPKLCETKLGWIVSGPVALPLHPSSSKQSHFCNMAFKQLESNLNRFWELDSVSPIHSQSREERACEESFLQNTTRDEQGRFVVTIPLKDDPSVLGESYQMAKRRFFSLERRFQRDPVFKERYVSFMQEYERLGHMTPNDPSYKPHAGSDVDYFIPHHGVVRESSTSTKLRAVFDASAATTSGTSLNNIQLVGPTVQDDLLSILLRFRQHKYVVSADIEKMYRAIYVCSSQRCLQQIVFRSCPQEPLKTYRLNTVTYGMAAAPYLATKCLVSLASAAKNERTRTSIQRDFYVDDYLAGSDSIPSMLELVKEVVCILSSANFHLRKWQSNSQHVLEQIADASESSRSLDLSDNKTMSSKTLGLEWLCKSDSLGFAIGIDTNKLVTKRHILSVISQIFDPLGLVGPCVIEAKIIMQQLWITRCEWDEEVSHEIRELWLSFANILPCLNNLSIPRWVLCTDSALYEIHVFSDASERAYGACVYVRSTGNNEGACVQLLVSKNRVAPIKPTTIPRLELCGALLGTRLCTKVLSSVTLPINRVQFWCDSTIVLSWLRMAPNLLKPFVRNRVDEIQESTLGYTWSYVPSKENPADLVSRGLKADQISSCSLWWSGPQFLSKHEKEWPKMPNDTVKQDLPEVVLTHHNDHCSYHLNPSNQSQPCIIKSIIHKFSSLNRVQRVTAYILRFIYNVRNKNYKRLGFLSNDELDSSLNVIMRHAQIEMFSDEYKLLQSGKALPRKNRLVSLSPFLDPEQVIRVGGRLDNSPYDFNVKHPILMCSKHHLTKILFEKEHLRLLHAGPQLLLANIRQTYWPLGGRNLSKTVVKGCIKCFRYKCQNMQPIMGQLPISRTCLEFPFLNCSVDYAGPILIADRKGRGCRLIKSYLCIFVCLAVKAVHIELVTDLTKEGYIAALNRFVARRGKPISILSDNGTNFVGTCNELQRFLQDSNITYEVAQQGIEFSFAPPYSPHFNGIAEAAVRSTKHHLKRLLQLTHFTYEEMATCLAQIEAVLNSRPLTPLSSDPLDFTAITPAHLLIGRPLISVPHPQVVDTNFSRLERHQRIEHMKQHFWNRFHLEYVSLLQNKTKWTSTSGQLSVGTLVLLKEKGQPPLVWLLGRVIKVFPGRDGATRVAELKTKKGTLLRAFNNICPLPLS